MFKDQDEEGTSICEFMKKQTTHDVIDHPSHYTWRGEESLEWLGGFISKQTDPKLAAYEWNVGKYLYRYPKKNGVEDLKKARKYIDLMIVHMEGKTNE